MSETKQLGIHFGALAEPISKQLGKQGYSFNANKVKNFEQINHAIQTLGFGAMVTDGQRNKLEKKLFKKIERHVCAANKLSLNIFFLILSIITRH